MSVIAAHDRMGANGVGCYATHERLAELAACEYHSLSRTLKLLGELGYVERLKHPLNGRLRVYRVIYNKQDAAWFKHATVSTAANNGDATVSEDANEDGLIVSKPNEEASDSNKESVLNILGETSNTSCETGNTFSETASLPRRVASETKREVDAGEVLARTERALKVGAIPPFRQWQQYCENLLDTTEYENPFYHWAERLIVEYGEASDAA